MRFGIRLRSPRAAISLMFALNGIVWSIWIARVPGVANHLDVSKSQLGSVLPAFAIGALTAGAIAETGLPLQMHFSLIAAVALSCMR